MALSNYSLSTPPQRYSLWKLFNEAWGYFTGGIAMGDLDVATKLLESQVHFHEDGHNHNATTDSGGKPLVTTGLLKKHFNLNAMNVVWGNYYQPLIYSSNIFVVLSGSGTCNLTSTTTGMGYGTGTTGLVYGTVLIDFNPYDTTWATTQKCQLDLRYLAGYNSAAPFNSNWTLAFAYACPIYAAVIDRYLVNQAFGFQSAVTPYFRLAAHTTVTGTMTFDYKVVLQRL
jgi:hypothetical protein